MPARKKMTPVEMLIVMAIAGIMFSILVPNMERAKRRSASAERPPAVEVATGEGQFNTIETPELAKPREGPHLSRWIGVFVGLVPIIIAGVAIYAVFNRLRKQMTGRA